jgi:hypothetical protein
MTRQKAWVLGALGAVAGAGLVRWQLARLFTESPPYELERRLAGFELRSYPPSVRAETNVHGGRWRDALGEGFRRLAGYIFGGNRARERIVMTAPVTIAASGGERIAMTTPVTASAPSADSAGGAEGVTVGFVMPAHRTVDSLPLPSDARVTLRNVPRRRVAAMRYTGAFSGARTAKMSGDLLDRVRGAGLHPRGEPSFAGYDPPWTLPLLRRNEVWVEVD